MKKAWRIVIAIVLVCVLLGAVCIGVGMITGADMERIYSVLDDRYHLTMYYQYGLDVMAALESQLF